MRITQRLVALLLIVSLAFAFLIYLVFQIKKQEGTLYSQADALQRRQIINAFIDIKKNDVMRLIDENSDADVLLDFAKGWSKERAAGHLDRLMTRNELDLIQFYDASGKPLYNSTPEHQAKLRNMIFPPEFFSALDKEERKYFTAAWQQNYMQIGAATIHPVVDTSYTYTQTGYLIIGRLWSLDYLKDMSQTLDYNIRFSLNEPDPGPINQFFNVNISVPLQGWDGKPIAWLRFSSNNPFVEQWRQISNRMLLLMLGFTLIFLFLQFALLAHWIQSPLLLISSSLKQGDTEAILPLSKKHNEFGEIANLIRRFFEQNQQLRNEMEERRKTEIMLRQAQKIESIGTLAGGIAHDFNNIITIISGYVAMAAGKAKGETDVRNNLDEAMLACLRAKKLIEKILTFSRQGERDIQPVQMAKLVEETVDMLSQTIPASTTIKKVLKSNAHVLADPTEMQQVVMNIVSNSYHAMRYQAGTITIELSDTTGNQIRSLVSDAEPGRHYVCLTVKDTGYGIPQDILDRIFDPYFSTKAAGEGTGLGLSIVHGIVTGNDGFIHISSVVEQGTTVTVMLPATTLREVEKKVKTARVEFISARIFFVDDEKALTNLFRETLTEAGYIVTTFTDGKAALEKFAENSADCELLIADIAMPEINGIQLATKFRKLDPALPIILYSGFSDATIQKSCRDLGINRLLIKPVLPDTLIHIIRELLASLKTL